MLQTIKWLKLSILIFLLGFAITGVVCFSLRLFYPFELEWMEGHIISHGLRFATGRPIYIDPQKNFVPYLYPPLYYWLIAGLISIFGPHLWTGRLVSIISFFLAGYLIYKIVKSHTNDKFAATVACLLITTCYGVVGYWFDIVRSDSLFIALILGACYYTDDAYNAHWSHLGVAVILFSLAFFTKQTAVIFIMVAGLYLLIKSKKTGFLFCGIMFLLNIALAATLNYKNSGWYWFYIFDVPTKHHIHPDAFINGIRFLAIKIPVILLLVFTFCLYLIINKRELLGQSIWYIMLPAAILASLLPYAKTGGFLNNFFPVVVFSAILIGIIIGYLNKKMLQEINNQYILIGVLVLLFFQAGLLINNPTKIVPKANDYAQGNALIKKIGQIKGDVYVVDHPLYAKMANKKEYPIGFAVNELHIAGYDFIPQDLKDKIRRKDFSAIITDYIIKEDTTYKIDREIITNYYLEEEIEYKPQDAFMPFTGYMSRPMTIYLPKKQTDL